MPCKCPVCAGVGTMPQEFYNPPLPGVTVPTAPIAMRVPCRACYGRGIVFAPTYVPAPYYPNPWYHYPWWIGPTITYGTGNATQPPTIEITSTFICNEPPLYTTGYLEQSFNNTCGTTTHTPVQFTTTYPIGD